VIIVNYSNVFQMCLICFDPKGGPTKLQKFQIKYRWKELEIRNTFPYRIFSRLEMEFELKFKELSMS
jgi:hypothetical protein